MDSGLFIDDFNGLDFSKRGSRPTWFVCISAPLDILAGPSGGAVSGESAVSSPMGHYKAILLLINN